MMEINKAQKEYAMNIIKGKIPECELPRTLEEAQAYLAGRDQARELSRQASQTTRTTLKQFLDTLMADGHIDKATYDKYFRLLK